MARGWESKEVESQQEEFSRAKQKKQERTPEQLERERKRDSLELQRTRVMRELENCKNDRVRDTLTEGLKYLEAQLKALKGDS
jgi:hypothetical protein